jgi:hypothetical protein
MRHSRARTVRSISRLLTLALIAVPAAAAAPAVPPKVEVGSPWVDGSRLQPYVNAWRMQVTKKDGETIADAGIWRDQLEAVHFAGRACWKRTQVATFKKKDGTVAATHVTINVFDRRTLAPVSREFRSERPGAPDSSTRINFTPRSLTIETAEGPKQDRRVARVEPAFDFDGGLYAVLWSAFDLRPGFAASFPSYSESDAPETIAWHSFSVVGRETIVEPGLGRVEALVVEGGSESGTLKYWLIARPPFVLRMDYSAANGAHWLLDMTDPRG